MTVGFTPPSGQSWAYTLPLHCSSAAYSQNLSLIHISSSTAASSTASSAAASSAAADGQKYTVGICQLVEHAALDAATPVSYTHLPKVAKFLVRYVLTRMKGVMIWALSQRGAR